MVFYFILFLGGKDRVKDEKVPGGQKSFDKYLVQNNFPAVAPLLSGPIGPI